MPANDEYLNSRLYRIRHSVSHIMAEAVLERFPGGENRHRSTD